MPRGEALLRAKAYRNDFSLKKQFETLHQHQGAFNASIQSNTCLVGHVHKVTAPMVAKPSQRRAPPNSYSLDFGDTLPPSSLSIFSEICWLVFHASYPTNSPPPTTSTEAPARASSCGRVIVSGFNNLWTWRINSHLRFQTTILLVNKRCQRDLMVLLARRLSTQALPLPQLLPCSQLGPPSPPATRWRSQ